MKSRVLFGLFAWALVAGAVARAEEGIEFDEFFLGQFDSAVFDAGQINNKVMRQAARRAIRRKSGKHTKKEDLNHSALFLEIFEYFVNYAREFDRNVDRSFSRIGDFRAAYVRQVSDLPWLSLQVEAFRASAENEAYRFRSEGGGAGVRVDLKTADKGDFTFMLMPLYGERRSIRALSGNHSEQSGWDGILRTSAGVAYTYAESDVVQPGVQVLYQPQIIDLGQFRVYAEAFVRLRIKRAPKDDAEFWAVSEINLVPKVIYWKSTDDGGLFGDDVNLRFGDALYRLEDRFYAFCNVEFRFRR